MIIEEESIIKRMKKGNNYRMWRDDNQPRLLVKNVISRPSQITDEDHQKRY